MLYAILSSGRWSWERCQSWALAAADRLEELPPLLIELLTCKDGREAIDTVLSQMVAAGLKVDARANELVCGFIYLDALQSGGVTQDLISRLFDIVDADDGLNGEAVEVFFAIGEDGTCLTPRSQRFLEQASEEGADLEECLLNGDLGWR